MELQAQTLYVRANSGNQQDPYLLSSVRKLRFSAGNLNVYQTSGYTNNYTITSIRYLNFFDLTGILNTNIQEKVNFILSPNPVNNILTINYSSLVDKTLKLDLIAIDGKVVYQQILSTQNEKNTTNVDISSLPKGLYLCRLSNGITITSKKFIKN